MGTRSLDFVIWGKKVQWVTQSAITIVCGRCLQGLNGWYQLLDEVKGQSEYHQVPSTISRTEGAQGDPGVKRFAVTLVRSERGYGFSVDGLSPVFISKVLKGQSARVHVECCTRSGWPQDCVYTRCIVSVIKS